MRVPDHWGIIGFPISHSLTPRLFEIVGKYVGIEGSNNLSIETQNIEDFITNSLPILNEYDEEATIWLSCTTPMKHEIRFLCDHIFDEPRGPNGELIDGWPINQLMKLGKIWYGTNTDGSGFVAAIEHIGIKVKGTILKIKGGGSTAISIATAWSASGGKIIPVEGRRKLINQDTAHDSWKPWRNSIIEDCYADLAIDVDVINPTKKKIERWTDAKRFLSITYNEKSSIDDFGVIMVSAQHLEAWKGIFTKKNSSWTKSNSEVKLPTLSQILELLDN